MGEAELPHLPDRYYQECRIHGEPDISDFESEEEFDGAFDEYEQEHFSVGEDYGIIACDESFIGICCIACTSENDDWIVPWPCDQAVINDYVIEQAVQKSQNPLPFPA